MTLLIDTCGEPAVVALAEGDFIVSYKALRARRASQAVLQAVSGMLQGVGHVLTDVKRIGVISGPGSFTGMRVGLAAAKGLAEALNIRVAAVSRLQALAGDNGVAAIDAGRGDVYLLADCHERSVPAKEVAEIANGRTVRVADEQLADRLEGCVTLVRPLNIEEIANHVSARFAAGGDDVATLDANYVRAEAQLYKQPPAGAAA